MAKNVGKNPSSEPLKPDINKAGIRELNGEDGGYIGGGEGGVGGGGEGGAGGGNGGNGGNGT
jgi:hypothetical protein